MKDVIIFCKKFRLNIIMYHSRGNHYNHNDPAYNLYVGRNILDFLIELYEDEIIIYKLKSDSENISFIHLKDKSSIEYIKFIKDNF